MLLCRVPLLAICYAIIIRGCLPVSPLVSVHSVASVCGVSVCNGGAVLSVCDVWFVCNVCSVCVG